jgi:Trk K+ transport system NAD-binding subunit
MGMKEAIIVIAVMNLVELAVLIGLAALGFSDIEPRNFEPLAPMGWGPFVPAMALIYISYVGIELISNAAEEIIQPSKNIPRAIIITLGVSTAIYVFVVGVMMGTTNYTELAHSEIPFIFTAERLFGAWGRVAGIIATIMASLSAFSVTLGASARILYALGLCALIVIIFSSSGIVKFVASLSDFGYLMGLGIINYAVIPLHNRMPNLRRPFQTIFFPWIPILGVITTWMFVPALESRSFVLGGILTLIGSAIYLSRSDNRAEVFKLAKVYVKSLKLFIYKLRRIHMRVLIISGEKQGQNIADRLVAKDEYHMMFRSAEHQVTFIEEDETLCKELEQRYNVPIYQGDGTKKELMGQVGIDNIDVVIAAFADDGRNVIAALQARQLKLEKVIAIVQNHEYTQLLEQNKVVVVNALWATAAMVENILDNPVLAQLFEFGIGAASLLEVSVPEDAKVNGNLIRDIDIPKGCLIAAIIRDSKFVVPRGVTNIEVDDRVIFIGPASAIKKAFNIFMLKK